jgi:hypothetical protein
MEERIWRSGEAKKETEKKKNPDNNLFIVGTLSEKISLFTEL